LQILKNQADMKSLADFEKSAGHETFADFEKSGGHEKSCGF
jgi:hypothetical protein